MIKLINNWLARRRHDKLVEKYLVFGESLGNALSYSYLGNPYFWWEKEEINLTKAFEILDQLEERYASYGYRVISLDSWILYGGYSKPINNIWLVKRRPGERPKFTKGEKLDEFPKSSEIFKIAIETGRVVEAIQKDDGEYEYRFTDE